MIWILWGKTRRLLHGYRKNDPTIYVDINSSISISRKYAVNLKGAETSKGPRASNKNDGILVLTIGPENLTTKYQVKPCLSLSKTRNQFPKF